MSLRKDQVGFNQRVRLEWLEQTANLVLAGTDKPTLNDALQEMLKDKVSVGNQAERGNREKVITILLKIWLTVPADLEPLRIDGLELIRRLPRAEHLAVHWAMAMATYPFWAEVAGSVGRLLKLQGVAAALHVQRRMREQYGERETVSRAARRVMRSFIDWGVLRETDKKGIYQPGQSLIVSDPHLAAWMIEALLHAQNGETVSFRDLTNNSRLFPFVFESIGAGGILSASTRLDIFRQGLDEQMVMLILKRA